MITFPGLKITLNVNKVAFGIFGINVYWYGICIALAILLAFVLSIKSKQKFNIDFETISDIFIFGTIFGVIGARIYYVLFNLNYYMANLIKIINIRDGGLAIYGGLISGSITAFFICKKRNVNVLDFFDLIVPFVALAQTIGRWGNFFNQEAYGTQTSSLFRMGIYTNNGYEEVHPAFLYESICTFIIFIILKFMQKNRKFKGEIFYLYLFLYSGIRMVIESVRIDSLMFKNLRISQILSIAIFVVSCIMLSKKVVKKIYRKIHSFN